MKPVKKGRAHGAAMMVWLFFANLFDPAKVAATEQLDRTRRRGDDAQRAAEAAAVAPPESSRG